MRGYSGRLAMETKSWHRIRMIRSRRAVLPRPAAQSRSCRKPALRIPRRPPNPPFIPSRTEPRLTREPGLPIVRRPRRAYGTYGSTYGVVRQGV